jgi:hypothetical protein
MMITETVAADGSSAISRCDQFVINLLPNTG